MNAVPYTVLARRYRSQNFDELVGQEAVAQTLKNAVAAGRIAHAFIFTGTRGVGKTSSARILAKAINCPNVNDGQPCGTCDTCLAIARGEDMDVIEIDGASNNGVDQIRELRQSAGIRPSHSPYKIYIIDEVHMLSGGAFNALLKTLEEPPSHVKFIFATTDIHKVPATIISRCQRFDFKNIPTQKIADHLAAVVKQEGMTADADAVFRIARLGNGSMRDALSLLDRVLSLGESHITEALLEQLLGKPASSVMARLVGAIAAGDPATTLGEADGLLGEAMGPEQLLSELIEFFRYLMLVVVCGPTTPLLDIPTEQKTRFTELAPRFDAPGLVHAIVLCEQTLRNLKGSAMARPLLDALLVRLALAEQFSDVAELLANEQERDTAGAAAQKKNDRSDVGATPTPHASNSALPQSRGTAVPRNEPTPEPDDNVSTTGASHSALSTQHPALSPPSDPNISVYQEMKDQLKNRPVAAPVRAANGRPMPPGRPQLGRPAAAPADAPNIPTMESVNTPEDRAAAWKLIRQYLLATKSGSLETLIGDHGTLDDVSADIARITLPETVREMVERSRERLETALRAVLHRPTIRPVIQYVAVEARPEVGPPTARRIPPEVEQAVHDAPIIRTLMEKMDAKITSVELIDE